MWSYRLRGQRRLKFHRINDSPCEHQSHLLTLSKFSCRPAAAVEACLRGPFQALLWRQSLFDRRLFKNIISRTSRDAGSNNLPQWLFKCSEPSHIPRQVTLDHHLLPGLHFYPENTKLHITVAKNYILFNRKHLSASTFFSPPEKCWLLSIWSWWVSALSRRPTWEPLLSCMLSCCCRGARSCWANRRLRTSSRVLLSSRLNVDLTECYTMALPLCKQNQFFFSVVIFTPTHTQAITQGGSCLHRPSHACMSYCGIKPADTLR